jgi:hypothetical protein
MFGKNNSRKIRLSLALMTAFVFCVIASLIYQWQSAEQRVRDKIHEYNFKVEQCVRQLEHESFVPVLGGGKLALNRVWRVGVHFTFSSGKCGADLSENLFWWSGSELVVNDQSGFDPRKVTGWLPYKVTVSFRDVHSVLGSQITVYQNDQRLNTHVSLQNYPGMELRLPARPPSASNRSAILKFFLTKRQSAEDSDQFFSCRFAEGSIAGRSTSSEKLAALLEKDIRYLETIHFSNEDLLCELDGRNFDLGEGMGGRVFFDSASLKQAPEALPAIRKYIIDSVTKD